MKPLFAGLDVSTQSTKLVVIDPATGEVVHIDRIEYDRDLPRYGTEEGAVAGLGEGVSESDPRMWTEAVDTLLGRLREAGVAAHRIRCISVSGQQHGLVALAADGSLARPRAKLWNDFSTLEECQILTDAVGGPEAMIEEVGNTQRTGYTAPKILHLKRHEPENYARAHVLLVVHNYINWHLTGGAAGGIAVLEPGDTSGMALWHPGLRQWSRVVIDAIDPALPGKLPPLQPADRSIGNVGSALAARFGLAPECRIDAGSGDNMYGAVGTGNIEPGMVTVSLGTSGTACTILEEPFIDPTGEIAAYCDSTGRYLPLLCVSNMANGYNAVLEHFDLTHEEFDDIVRRTPPGNGGRVLIPWYEGERTPDLPLAAPGYFGFDLPDFMPEVLCRAVLEGHVMNLYEGSVSLPVTPREIRLTGGLANSPSWCQTIADVFDAETVPVQGEGAALGAAIHAAWVWYREEGDERGLEGVARPFVVLDEARRARPDPQQRATYEVLRRLYRAVSRRLRGLEGEDPFALRRQMRSP
ncbi:MAG TPA: FGGY family carbohydrate kinase [Gemmatimonadota bacterium]|nr:FGGY family carbohydrate kinase [Gemmatimonadota bacterium]